MRGRHVRRRPRGWGVDRPPIGARRRTAPRRREKDGARVGRGDGGAAPTRGRPIEGDGGRPKLERLLREAAADPRVISFAGGLPSEKLFPRSRLARAFVRAMARSGAPGLQYGWAEGSPALRSFIAARLGVRGARVTADDVIVTSGAQQAIAIALQLVAPRAGRVAVDDETYPALLDLLRAQGLRPVSNLAAASCVYAMPAIANPCGHGASPARRRALLGSGAMIIEDDAYADLRFSGPPPPSLLADAPERVFHVGTLSKILCPGLRIGWLVPPPSYRARALALKQGSDLQASSLGQAIVEDYLSAAGAGRRGPSSRAGSGRLDFDARLVRLRTFYRRRAEVLAHALDRHLPSWRFAFPEGGFSIWASTEERLDEARFLEAAVLEGVSFDVGSQFRATAARGAAADERPTALRICFSFVSPTKVDEGVRRLGRAFRRIAGQPRR
jgi:2-aminoadipate transaminase